MMLLDTLYFVNNEIDTIDETGYPMVLCIEQPRQPKRLARCCCMTL